MLLLGGEAVPLHRLGVVLRHASASFQHGAETELGLRMALLGGEAVPFRSLGRILRHAPPGLGRGAEIVPASRMVLLGRTTVQPHRLSVVLGHATAVGIHPAETELRIRSASYGELVQ